MHMDGNTRLLIVGGAMALVAYFGWPYVKGEMGSIGQQLSGNPNRTGFPPLWDPLGLMPNRGNPGEGDYGAAPGRRLRLPPGVGNAQGRAYGEDGIAAEPQGRVRRWRDCRAGSIWSDKLQCGPWHDGEPPGRR
jgi:hypothetical protein